jgi:hypothetical protein
MATNTTVLFRGAASTSNTTLYTVPSGRTAIISNIAVANTSGSAQTFTLNINGAAIQSGSTIAANSTAYIDLKQVVAATQVVSGSASATSVNFHISGIEVF